MTGTVPGSSQLGSTDSEEMDMMTSRTNWRGMTFCCLVGALYVSAGELQAQQQSSSGLRTGASAYESNEPDPELYLTGDPPNGTTYHDVPDGPALIRHMSGPRRAFTKPLKMDGANEMMAQFYINVFLLSHADFDLAGRVVDESMKPVGDVQMTVTASECTDIWNGTRRTNIFRQRLTDGSFRIQLQGYSKVEVVFEKNGFRHLAYTPELADPDPKDLKYLNIDQLKPDDKPDIRAIKKEGLRAKLSRLP